MLESHLPKSRYRQPGQRVVQGQRMMQATSDIFLGWTTGVDTSRSFYWRQLRDMKGSAEVEVMTPEGMTFYATTCGWTLARAHARSGDPVALARVPRRRRRVRRVPSPTSPSATPSRTTATSRRSPTPSVPAGSRPPPRLRDVDRRSAGTHRGAAGPVTFGGVRLRAAAPRVEGCRARGVHSRMTAGGNPPCAGSRHAGAGRRPTGRRPARRSTCRLASVSRSLVGVVRRPRTADRAAGLVHRSRSNHTWSRIGMPSISIGSR